MTTVPFKIYFTNIALFQEFKQGSFGKSMHDSGKNFMVSNGHGSCITQLNVKFCMENMVLLTKMCGFVLFLWLGTSTVVSSKSLGKTSPSSYQSIGHNHTVTTVTWVGPEITPVLHQIPATGALSHSGGLPASQVVNVKLGLQVHKNIN